MPCGEPHFRHAAFNICTHRFGWGIQRNPPYLPWGILMGFAVGAFIPERCGKGVFSYSSGVVDAIGAFVGSWLGFKPA